VEFVVCTKCGTRIKSGREYCLRCGDELPAAGSPAMVTMWESLELSEQMKLTLLGASILAVVALVCVIWSTREKPEIDGVHAVAAPQTPRPAVTPAVADEAPAAVPVVPATPAPTPAPPPVANSTDAMLAGATAFKADDFVAARAAFELAIAQRPDDAEAVNNLGLTLDRLGKKAEAVGRFEQAISVAPDKSAYHFNLGHALSELQQWDRAVGAYREALRLFPGDYATQYNIAMILHKRGDHQAAIPEFQKAIQLAPGEPSFHLSLGMSLERVGRVADAAREYRTYLEMAPGAPEAVQLKVHLETLGAAGKARS
jgi:Flp pilus assembly protein TadD